MKTANSNIDKDKLIDANTKLVDKNKMILNDIRFLIKYLKGSTEEKEEMQEYVDNLINYYEKKGNNRKK